MAYLYDLTDTWNAAGTVFNAIKMNVTNSASAAGSKIVSLQVGSTDRFTVDKDGNGYFSGTLQAVGAISFPNAYLSGNSGTIGMQDNTASILAYNGTGSGGITNTLRFITGASERLRIDGSGNIGIGTSSPSSKFVVSNSGAAGFEINPIGSASAPALYSYNRNTNAYDILTTIASEVRWQTGSSPSERMRITSGGDVLVGKTAASVGTDGVQLLAAGYSGFSAAGTTALFLNRNTNDGTILEFGRNGVSAATMGLTSSALTFGTAGSERMRIDSTGSVGIGTSSPSVKLDVAITGGMVRAGGGSGNNLIQVYTGGGTTGLGMWAGGSARFYSTNGLTFSVNSTLTTSIPTGYTDAMTLDSSGNVQIGTTLDYGRLTAAESVASGDTNISIYNSAGAAVSGVQGTKISFLNDSGFSEANPAAYIQTRSNDGGGSGQTSMRFGVYSGSAVAEAMRITSAGNVGIGTNSPANKLDVNGTAGATAYLLNSSSHLIYSGSSTEIAFRIGASGPYYGIGTTGSNNMRINSASGGDMLFSVSGSEYMRINYLGNVGIGTSSPGAKLEVVTSSSTSAIFQTLLDQGGNTAVRRIQLTAVNFRAAIQGESLSGTWSANDLLLNPNGGNVGIGTSTAGAKLTVIGSASKLYVDLSGDNYYDAANHVFRNFAGTERARIDSSGNLLVGSTTNSARLFTKVTDGSNSFGAAGTTKGVRITHDSTMSTIAGVDYTLSASYQPLGINGSDLRFLYSGTEGMRLDSSGNLLVGTTSTNPTNGFVANTNNGSGFYLQIGHPTGTGSGVAYERYMYNQTEIGSITQNGTTAVAYNTSSDYRLKDIAGPIQNSGAYIDALKPVQGSWKADGSRFIGLIAHEVQEVSETQIATGVKDGETMQAMDYSAPELIANLIAEIQSLRARVAQLEGN